jgi:copper transport protein
MSRIRRSLIAALLALGILGASAGPALAHASLIGSVPALNEKGISEETTQVTLVFSEPVSILNRSDVTVVNQRNLRVDTGAPHLAKGDATRVIVPLHRPLLPASYTVRYRLVASDSHEVSAAWTFAVGRAQLAPPILAGSGGLTDSSPVSVAARAIELLALALLIGLIAFRAFVWGPAVKAASGLDAAERGTALRHGQRIFWRAFWTLAVITGLAETAVLAAKTGVVFHTGFFDALVHPNAEFRLVGASRFGDLLGWRCGALFALVGVGFVIWSSEKETEPTAGERWPLALMGAFGALALALLASQGHAAVAPLAPLSIAADAVHLGGAAIWIGGLPCLVALLLRAPKAVPEGGRTLASAALKQFSKVALWSIVVISVTGLARMLGELSSPVQLWETGYGRDLMLKASLLLPILVIARRNRQFVAALGNGLVPTAARLRTVARSVQMELAIAMGIITVAAILVAQFPGRG